jgi:site-specific recombinase XerD
MGAQDVEAFLTHLAVAGKVAATTQNQAKSALLFLYREVLEIQLLWLNNVTQAKAPKRLPVVLTVSEVQAVLAQLRGTHLLIASLLYGGGMRLMEAVRLRVKDVEFARHEILGILVRTSYTKKRACQLIFRNNSSCNFSTACGFSSSVPTILNVSSARAPSVFIFAFCTEILCRAST